MKIRNCIESVWKIKIKQKRKIKTNDILRLIPFVATKSMPIISRELTH